MRSSRPARATRKPVSQKQAKKQRKEGGGVEWSVVRCVLCEPGNRGWISGTQVKTQEENTQICHLTSERSWPPAPTPTLTLS